MGAVNWRIAPEASPFRDDVDFDGPGAWEKTTFRKMLFFENMARKYFPKNIFSGHTFQKKSSDVFFKKMGRGGNFGFGGRAGKNSPLISRLILNTFLVMKIVAVGAIEILLPRKVVNISRGCRF